ncbi:DUF1641 domain-containing protein [Metallosphaera hakonensis]|uniref:DUF1641 domain-containing protein n=1 Tax=Metallosphaera hakonensis JCM 8857 = DSM 7519 TaxID=1293036 RepID=A0A2U9IW71_9CREN|nr:DUF1641 domain-containing protein [Metallosphaera hakonensis]AWS00289.1 DUF1641 domain-containing protein [Metallosphaera hakonensis JCM 8857 = DSM 7519]
MDERGVQTIDRMISELAESGDALEQFLKLINALNRTGILPFLVGIAENLDKTLADMTEQNAGLIRTMNAIYSILNGDEETQEVTLARVLQELNDPDVKRGLLLILKVIKAIGSASKQGQSD